MVVRTTRNVTSGLTRITYAQERDMGRETAATGAALEVLIVGASQGNSFRRRLGARRVNRRENAMAGEHQDDARSERQRAHSDVRDGDRYISGRGLNCIARGEDGPIGHSAEHELSAQKNIPVTMIAPIMCGTIPNALWRNAAPRTI